MFNPGKEFHRIVIDTLGKDGKSISSLAKDLEKIGFKHHRLILTGYLRALTDTNILKEREVPPSKIYQPVRPLSDSIYDAVGRSCRKISPDPDELILFCLSRLLKRPVFEPELRASGVTRPIGKDAPDPEVQECRKFLRRSGNIINSNTAVYPVNEFPEQFLAVLADIALESTDSRHLLMDTKQTRLML
jgi:hypothetical protein